MKTESTHLQVEKFAKVKKWNAINWRTDEIYVDIESGEIIEKNRVTRGEYIKTNQTTKYTKDEYTNIKEIVKECEKSKQNRLFEW